MKRLRRLPPDPDAADFGGQYRRSHLSRKEYRALGGDYAPPRRKPSKAARAKRRRREQEQLAERRLTKRPRSNAPWWVALKAEVLAVGRCAFCGSTKQLTVDHITPLGAGGTNARRNLQCLCNSCNQAKGNQTGIFLCPT